MKPLTPATRVRAVEPRRCCGTCPYVVIGRDGFYQCVRPDGPSLDEKAIWSTVCDGWAPFTNARYVEACALMDVIEGEMDYVYIGLLTDLPSDAVPSGEEPQDPSYARVRTKAHDPETVTFPKAEENRGLIYGLGVFDAPEGGGLLYLIAHDEPFDMWAGSDLVIHSALLIAPREAPKT